MQSQPGLQEIFNYISDILATKEFKLALAEFFEKNASQFDYEEENKHIYKTIHSEYQNVVDTALESKLLEQFPGVNLENFFTDFAENFQNFKDQETVDTLHSFTDFEKFKKMMLEYTNKENEGKESEGTSDINPDLIMQFFEKDVKEWSKVLKGKTKYDVSIFTTPYKSTGINIVRAQFYIEDINIEKVMPSFSQEPKEDENDKNQKKIEEQKIVQLQDGYIIYKKIAPPAISQREFLVKCTTKKINDTYYEVIQRPIEHTDFPITDKAIRAVQLKCFRINQEGKDVFIDTVSYTDMKGYIPKMFMNMMLTKIISGVISSKVEQFKKEKRDK